MLCRYHVVTYKIYVIAVFLEHCLLSGISWEDPDGSCLAAKADAQRWRDYDRWRSHFHPGAKMRISCFVLESLGI